MQVHAYTGEKCFIFFFHKGTTVIVWYLHVVLLLPVYIVYTYTVHENENMGVFGMYCNILAKLSRIANSIIVPLPHIWQVFLHVSTILNACQTVLLLVTQLGVYVKHETFITILWEGWLEDISVQCCLAWFYSAEQCFWAQAVTPEQYAEEFDWSPLSSREGCCSISVEVGCSWWVLISSWTVLSW